MNRDKQDTLIQCVHKLIISTIESTIMYIMYIILLYIMYTNTICHRVNRCECQ